MYTRQQVLSLYKSLIKESNKFAAYNYRNYAVRRVRDAFKMNKSLTDNSKITELVKEGFKTLDVIKRQVLIGSLYSTDKLVIENMKPHTSGLRQIDQQIYMRKTKEYKLKYPGGNYKPYMFC